MPLDQASLEQLPLRQVSSGQLPPGQATPGQASDSHPQGQGKASVRLVAFDFDGTVLEGHSPVRMIRRLSMKRIIPASTAFKTLWWGIRYKLHLPVEQRAVRKYIFKGFSHYPAVKANQIMSEFYCGELRHRLRPKAIETIRAHQAAGHKVVLVSASFYPILKEVSRDIQADWFICTQMGIEDGYYTGEVACTPPEGEQKLIQLQNWADKEFSAEGWELVAAYGDHRSDAPLLSAAIRAIAVNPDIGLQRTAKRLGWEIVDWSFTPN